VFYNYVNAYSTHHGGNPKAFSQTLKITCDIILNTIRTSIWYCMLQNNLHGQVTMSKEDMPIMLPIICEKL